jgi:hypothetical protein
VHGCIQINHFGALPAVTLGETLAGRTGGSRLSSRRQRQLRIVTGDSGVLAPASPAVAVLTRLTGDLETAEDAMQDACSLALTK